MAETRPVGKPRTFALFFIVGGFGLTLLLALSVIGRASGWWRFLFLILPLVFLGLFVFDVRRAGRRPDDRIPVE